MSAAGAVQVVRVVHDTAIVVVRDTVVRVAEQHHDLPNWHGLTPWMVVGWAVTVFGVLTAARVAVRGWEENAKTASQGWRVAARAALEAQEHRQMLDDEAARSAFLDILAESLRYFLWQLPFLARQVSNDGFIGSGQFSHLDSARASYDRNRERLILIQDEDIRRRVGRWFFGARIWRSSVELYYVVGTQEHGANIGVVKAALQATLNGALKEGKALYEALGVPSAYPDEPAYDALVKAEDDAGR